MMFAPGASARDANRGQALWYNAPGVKNNATITTGFNPGDFRVAATT